MACSPGAFYFYAMVLHIKDYKALTISGLITVGILFLLVHFGYVILDPGNMNGLVFILINVLGTLSLGGLLYYFLAGYSLYQVMGVIGLLTIAVLAERFLHVSENPITIPAMILFWLWISYWLLPTFFKKYWRGICIVYGLITAYYLFNFVTTANYGIGDRANFSVYLFIPIPIFGGLWLFEQWRWVKTLEADRTNAQLALLKSQVNPHFFFNTLNNLYGLVVEKSPKAPEVILQLSDLMRYTIDMGELDEVNVLNEISYIKNYLALHKIRYRNHVDISFEYDIDETKKIAPLLFINLLENAFKHGVSSLVENAFVHLILEEDTRGLSFKISNSFDSRVPKNDSGLGLQNLRKRLQHHYAKRHELIIDEANDVYQVQLHILWNPKQR